MSKVKKFFLVVLLIGVATGSLYPTNLLFKQGQKEVQEFWANDDSPRDLEEAETQEKVDEWWSAGETADNITDSWDILGGGLFSIVVVACFAGIVKVIKYRRPEPLKVLYCDRDGRWKVKSPHPLKDH